MNSVIATRSLLYSSKGESKKKSLIVKIFEPQLIDTSEVDYPVPLGASSCRIEIEGLPEDFVEEVHGADSIQALAFAIEIDGFLRFLQKKYDIFWASGEPYFED